MFAHVILRQELISHCDRPAVDENVKKKKNENTRASVTALALSNLPSLLSAFTTAVIICNLAIIISILTKCLAFCIRQGSLIGPMNLSPRVKWRSKVLGHFLAGEQAEMRGVKTSQLFSCSCHKHH